MCVRVQSGPADEAPAFDYEQNVIVVPNGLLPPLRAIVVRAILTELHAPQVGLGAVCWCGDPVNLTPRVPHQRRSEQVVKRHGA